MKWVLMTAVILLSACASHVPEGEMERMRAQMPRDQNPPAAYNQQGIAVP